MDLNVYTAAILAQGRLADLREAADRYHAARAARPPRPLRRAVGDALVRLGTRLLRSAPVRASV
jgi:hypothetical protein